VNNYYGPITEGQIWADDFRLTQAAAAIPSITTQPANKTVTAGSAVTFNVEATGSGLSYQWRKDGVNIAGATGSSYSIASVQNVNAGSYAVVVSNVSGTVTSQSAQLSVTTAGEAVALDVSDNFSAGIRPSMWTSVQMAQGAMTVAGTSGHASFLVPNSSTTEQHARLVWNGRTKANADWSVEIRGRNAASFSSNGASCLQLLVADSRFLSNPNNLYYFFHEFMRKKGADGTKAVFALSTTAGIESEVPVLAGTTNIGLRIVYRSSSKEFEAWYDDTGAGSNWKFMRSCPLSEVVPDATSSTEFVIAIMANNYFGPITEGQLWVDDFRLTQAASSIPAITTQPESKTVTPSSAVTLNVVAAGSGLSYQWRKDGVNIAGATGSSYSIASVQSTNAGSYTVVVSNVSGTVTSQSAQLSVATPVEVPLGMILVSGGTLPASSQLGALPVDTFYIGKTEVTWGEWKAVRTWAAANGYTDLANVGQGAGDNYPVTHVNWYDCVKWCNARSEKEGKTPVYRNGADVYRTGQVPQNTAVSLANGYRLPSEREWEFAARGGTQTLGYTYSGSNNLNAVAWSAVNEVGKKLPNELGIFDMSGNLWEWCWMPWREGSAYRTARGGFWYAGDSEGPAVANRSNEGSADYRYQWHGFRVASSSVPELVIVTEPYVSKSGTMITVQAQGSGTLTYQWMLNGVAIAGGTSSQLSMQDYSSGTYTVVVSNRFATVKSAPSPIGNFALVSGGTLPESSELGAAMVGTFYIGKTEVTWGEWKTVRTWAVANGYTDLANVGVGAGDTYPVSDVSWYDVLKWCNARSEREGKTPVYRNGAAVYQTGIVNENIVVSWADGYRLPSEKEWEFAARGGTQSQGYTYSGSNDLNAVGWYGFNSDAAVHEVGTKLANELGIYDMSGNISEWSGKSGTWHPGLYPESWRTYSYPVSRGGNWASDGFLCRPAFSRSYQPPDKLDDRTRTGLGFRVATSGEYALGFAAQPYLSSDRAKITVEAQGVGALTYQWRLNGAEIAGGTSAQLSTQGLQSGWYTVVVGNGFSSVTSSGIQYPSPIGNFALVTGGTLPASSQLGEVPVDTFYIGKTEVTWGEWKTVRTWAVANGYTDLANVGAGVGDNYPVSDVSWCDVLKWCNARSQKEGKTPVYKNGAAVYRTGIVTTPEVVLSANGYRLPSEKEWEFAARGGTQTQGYVFSGSDALDVVGWDLLNSRAVHQVGEKQPNELGIFDMSGNVWEWTESMYTSSDAWSRVIRGGAWSNSFAESCRVASRSAGFASSRGDADNCYGFRVACSSVP
jgi:formylglycine-generating enzyme required for sulfatase activity